LIALYPEKAGHPDVERVVVLDVLLAAQRVHDRCVQRGRRLDQFAVGAFHTCAAQNRDGLCAVEDFGRLA
jgi:hypothetical protein